MRPIASPYTPSASPSSTTPPPTAGKFQDAATPQGDTALLPCDQVQLEGAAGPDPRAVVEDEDDVAQGGIIGSATSTALLVAGAFCGLAGTVLPTLTQLSQPQPVLSTVSQQGQVQRHEMQPATFSPEQASADTHVIANVDATEPIIEPFATNDLGQYQSTTAKGHGHITADVQIERNADPISKLITGAEVGAITAAPFFIMRHFAKKQQHVALAIGLTMAGLAGSYVAGGMVGFAHDGIGSAISAVKDLQHPEGTWSGRHEVHMQDGQRSPGAEDPSQKVDPEQLAHFLGSHMKQYPSGNVVVTLTGHGLMYRHVSGIQGDALGPMLSQAAEEGGRPIDVLVLESCLAGNLETLNAIYPSARYAVVSEESIAAGGVGTMFENAAEANLDKQLTPRELASSLLGSARGVPGIETLAVIDLSQMPTLNAAVGQLGATLSAEVQAGHTASIKSALDGTMIYPQEDLGTAKQLAVGDLGQLAHRLLDAYKGDTSAQGEAVRRDAQGVLDALSKAVVGSSMTTKYVEQSGISIQLPGMDVAQLEGRANVLGARGLSSYANAQAPEAWRSFVTTMSTQLKAQAASTSPAR